LEIGVDCVDISRFDKSTISDDKFLNKIFTSKEIDYCKKKANPSQHYAARFAGKESVIKALSNYGVKIPLNEIEILNTQKGIPSVRILNDEANDYNIKISLAHSDRVALAFVLVDKKNKIS
jgi:holo-[acyl-carrier protein] synthase